MSPGPKAASVEAITMGLTTGAASRSATAAGKGSPFCSIRRVNGTTPHSHTGKNNPSSPPAIGAWQSTAWDPARQVFTRDEYLHQPGSQRPQQQKGCGFDEDAQEHSRNPAQPIQQAQEHGRQATDQSTSQTEQTRQQQQGRHRIRQSGEQMPADARGLESSQYHLPFGEQPDKKSRPLAETGFFPRGLP